ncbi:MAG: ABC transporter permease [Gemmatimonadaceae bacterium]
MPRKPTEPLPRGVRRLFSLPASRARLVRDADDEMRFHLEMWTQEFRARGMSDAEAEAAAQRRFGDTTEYRDYTERRATHTVRWQRVVEWLTEWMQDVRFAGRQFRKAPAFSALAVLTLALGIGANTAVFSVVHHLLIAPLPYPNGNRIVALKVTGRHDMAGLASFGFGTDAPTDPPHAVIDAWASRAKTLEMVAGADEQFLSILADGQQDTVTHAFVTANFLPLLGVQPAIGRNFRVDEQLADKSNVAMISYGWWQREYGGRDDVIGKMTEYDGKPYAIIGVMPAGLTMPMATTSIDQLSTPSPEVWIPAPLKAVMTTFGLLRTGVSAGDAANELQSIINAIRADNPRLALRAKPMRAQDFLAPREVRTIQILFAAVGVLLLIACANVANLLLVRAWGRRGEFAVRMGLGAGRARIVRLALTESVLLSLVAGALGILIAWQGVRAISALRPAALDSLAGVHIEPVVLFWTASISIGTGILFGGAAALFVGSSNVVDLLRSETRTSSGAGVSRRIRSSLIVLEIALSLTLLVGAGLLIRSFAALQQTPMGFDPHNLASVDILIPPAIKRAGHGPDVRAAVAQHLREMPGVVDAAVGTLPTAGFQLPSTLVTESATGDRPLGVSGYMTTWIDSNYFHAARIALVAGRLPVAGASDEATTPPFRAMSEEIVVNRALARRIAPDGGALGRRIRATDGGMRGPPGRDTPNVVTWSTIVGVSDDVHLPGVRGDGQDYQVYTMPLARMVDPAFVVRMATVPPNVESVLRRSIQTVNATLIVRRARLADNYVREALAPTRFAMALLGAFALVAFVLSVVGLYSSVAYSVSQRTRELGIRVALGASPKAVMRLVLGDGVKLALAGIGIGLVAAAATTRVLASLLYSVTASDPATFALIAGTVAAIALLASYIPARRAVRIDPVDALRAE